MTEELHMQLRIINYIVRYNLHTKFDNWIPQWIRLKKITDETDLFEKLF